MVCKETEQEAAFILITEAALEYKKGGPGFTPAFDLLYIMFSPSIMRDVLSRYYDTTDRITEASNLVWCKVWKGSASYNGGKAGVLAWLIAIAQNHARGDMIQQHKDHVEALYYKEVLEHVEHQGSGTG